MGESLGRSLHALEWKEVQVSVQGSLGIGQGETDHGTKPPGPSTTEEEKQVEWNGGVQNPFQACSHISANTRWNSMGLSSCANLSYPKENTMLRSTDKQRRGAPAVSVAFMTTWYVPEGVSLGKLLS